MSIFGILFYILQKALAEMSHWISLPIWRKGFWHWGTILIWGQNPDIVY